MFSFQNFFVFGIVLMFFAVILPLLIYINKGSRKESVEDKDAQKSFMETSWQFVLTYSIVFFVMPSLFVLFCNYVKWVVYDAMPFDEFMQELGGYSYAPVLDFYQRILAPIRAFFADIIKRIMYS